MNFVSGSYRLPRGVSLHQQHSGHDLHARHQRDAPKQGGAVRSNRHLRVAREHPELPRLPRTLHRRRAPNI